MKEIVTRTAVVGSGCAGLNAADCLAALGQEVLLITEGMNCGTSRNTGSDKQTYYKLSLAGDDGDSVGEMARTLCGPDVDGDIALCEAAGSARAFFKLVQLGVPFPANEMGEYVGYQTDHDTRRRATSAGPLTSRYMTEALEKSVRARGVPVLDNTLVFRILTGENGVCGLLCLDRRTRTPVAVRCANVVLATGGPAGIYADRVYPPSQFGMSGMALAAGCAGVNLHCWQYGLASVGFRWNVSGSYQQAIPRYVSVDQAGTEREFLAESLPGAAALDLVFLKGYQWPFDPRKAQGSSRIDLLVKQQTDLGRRCISTTGKTRRATRRRPLGPKRGTTWPAAARWRAKRRLARLQAINAPAHRALPRARHRPFPGNARSPRLRAAPQRRPGRGLPLADRRARPVRLRRGRGHLWPVPRRAARRSTARRSARCARRSTLPAPAARCRPPCRTPAR